MFKIGLPNKNSKYPGAERLDQPKFVLELDVTWGTSCIAT